MTKRKILIYMLLIYLICLIIYFFSISVITGILSLSMLLIYTVALVVIADYKK